MVNTIVGGIKSSQQPPEIPVEQPAVVEEEHGLVLEVNGPPDANRPPPRPRMSSLMADSDRLKIENHEAIRRMDADDYMMRGSRTRYFKDAVARMMNRRNQHFRDQSVKDALGKKSDGVSGYSQRPLKETLINGQSVATTQSHRNLLLQDKAAVLENVADHAAQIYALPHPQRVKSEDGTMRDENEREATFRVQRQLTLTRSAVRDLMIVVDTERRHLEARKDTGKISLEDYEREANRLDSAHQDLLNVDNELFHLGKTADAALQSNQGLRQARHDIAAQMGEFGRADPNTPAETLQNVHALLDGQWDDAVVAKDQSQFASVQLDDDLFTAAATKAVSKYEAVEHGYNSDIEDLEKQLAILEQERSELATKNKEFEAQKSSKWYVFFSPIKHGINQHKLDKCYKKMLDITGRIQVAKDYNSKIQDMRPRDISVTTLAMQEFFDAADSSGIGPSVDSVTYSLVENEVNDLGARLEEFAGDKSPLHGNGPLADEYSELKALARKFTFRRHFDALSEKIAALSLEFDQIDAQSSENAHVDPFHADAAIARKEAIATRLHQLNAAHRAVSKQAEAEGLHFDDNETSDEIAAKMGPLRQQISEHLKNNEFKWHAVRTKYAQLRRRALNNLKHLDDLTPSLKDAKNYKELSSRHDGVRFLTEAEMRHTKRVFEEHARAHTAYSDGKMTWTKSNSFSSLSAHATGVVRAEQGPSQAISDAVNASDLAADMLAFEVFTADDVSFSDPSQADGMLGAANKSAANVESAFRKDIHSRAGTLGFAGASHGYGMLASGYALNKRYKQIKKKQDKIVLGESIVEACKTRLDNAKSVKERVKAKYEDRVKEYCGQELAGEPLKLTGMQMGISTLGGLRHAVSGAAPYLQAGLAVTAKATGTSIGLATATVDWGVTAYKTGKAVIKTKDLEKLASAQKNALRDVCVLHGVDTAWHKRKSARNVLKDAKAAIEAKDDLNDVAKDQLKVEMDRLIAHLSLVELSQSKTNLDERGAELLAKSLSVIGYGAAFTATVAAAGGAVVLAPVAAAAGAAAGICGASVAAYKWNKGDRQTYQHNRATDALMGVSNPAVLHKLETEAKAKGVTMDRLALDLVAQKDNYAMAQELLGRLRYETADYVPDVDQHNQRVANEAQVFEVLQQRNALIAQRDAMDDENAPVDEQDKDALDASIAELQVKLDKLAATVDQHDELLVKNIARDDCFSVKMLRKLGLENDVIAALVESPKFNDQYAIRLIAERLAKMG